jgi:hypothetical protein
VGEALIRPDSVERDDIRIGLDQVRRRNGIGPKELSRSLEECPDLVELLL